MAGPARVDAAGGAVGERRDELLDDELGVAVGAGAVGEAGGAHGGAWVSEGLLVRVGEESK